VDFLDTAGGNGTNCSTAVWKEGDLVMARSLFFKWWVTCPLFEHKSHTEITESTELFFLNTNHSNLTNMTQEERWNILYEDALSEQYKHLNQWK
jgi:hypothetical protein